MRCQFPRFLLWFWLVVGTILMVAVVAHGQNPPSLDTGGWRQSRQPNLCQPGDPCYQGNIGGATQKPAQPPQAIDEKYAAIVRVSVEDSPGGFSSGTGTIIDREAGAAYVLGCSHLLDDWRGGQIIVQVRDQRYAATLLGRDPAIDAAVLKIRDPGVKPIPTSDVAPGDSWAGGYPSMRSLRWIKGQFIGWQEQAGHRNSRIFTRCAVFSGGVQSGDSGGPIVQNSPNGMLVAVIWGTDGGRTYGTPSPLIRKALGHLVPCWRRGHQSGSVMVNVQPEQPPLDPIVPEGPPTPPTDLTAINERLDALAAAIAAIPAGRTGDTGQQGERGLQGLPGPPGTAPIIDLDELVEKLIPKLPPLYFQSKDPSGIPTGPPIPKRLGETVGLRTEWLVRPKEPAGE